MAGYNRNSPNPFVDGAIIEANDFDTEFGNLDIAFGTSGHNHNGTDGNGPKITTSGLADDAVTGAKIDSTTTVTAASFVGNLDANSATIDSLTITSGTAVTSIDTDLSAVSATDNTLASAKAIKAYVDAQVDTADQLTELTDVTITSVADNEVLAYNNATSKWINQTATEAGLQPNDDGLTSIAGLTTAANKMIYTTAADTYATTSLTAAGRAILDDADASAQRTTLGLAIGTNVQAYDAGLNSISGLTTAADKMIYTTASDTYSTTSLTAFGRSLIDDADASAARTTLGLGTAATTASTAYATAAQGTTADNALPKAGGTMTGDITFNSTQTFDGRDVSADGAKLDGIEASADVTDTANVEAAGALMDSEVTNLAQVKAFSSADYATAAQGTTADSALQPADNISELTNDSGYITGNQTITLSGDATGSGTTAITVALAANTVGVNELNLTDGTAGQFLKTDGAGNISFATAPTQATSFTTLEVEPTDDHAIFSLQNTATNTFGNSKSYHEIRWDAKDLAGVDTTYAEIEGRTVASGARGKLLFNIKGASGLTDYLILDGDDQDIKATKNIKFSIAGTGIDFSSTTDGTGSGVSTSSEVFDDYEEGTFRPEFRTISNGSFFNTNNENVSQLAAGNVTFASNHIGRYTKVGNMVTLFIHFSISFLRGEVENADNGHTDNQYCIGNLPYALDPSITVNEFEGYSTGAVVPRPSGWAGACPNLASMLATDVIALYQSGVTGSIEANYEINTSDFYDDFDDAGMALTISYYTS